MWRVAVRADTGVRELIPGVPFTNGIRDLAAEDYIAGATRLLDALMVFLCIAVGVCITFLVDSHIEGRMIELHGMLTDSFTANWLFQIAAAFFGTGAFAVLFGVPRRYYVACGISGMMSDRKAHRQDQVFQGLCGRFQIMG